MQTHRLADIAMPTSPFSGLGFIAVRQNPAICCVEKLCFELGLRRGLALTSNMIFRKSS
jgi:hypothetical protein